MPHNAIIVPDPKVWIAGRQVLRRTDGKYVLRDPGLPLDQQCVAIFGNLKSTIRYAEDRYGEKAECRG